MRLFQALALFCFFMAGLMLPGCRDKVFCSQVNGSAKVSFKHGGNTEPVLVLIIPGRACNEINVAFPTYVKVVHDEASNSR